MNQAAFEGYPSLRMSAVARTFGTMGEFYLVGESRFQNPQLMCPVPVMITRTSVEKVTKDQIVLELQARAKPILGKIPFKDKLIKLLFSYVEKEKPPPERGAVLHGILFILARSYNKLNPLYVWTCCEVCFKIV
jgi:hypothetical protein